jgi:predicted dehydrogenase
MNILIIGLGSVAKKHIHAIHSLGIKASIFALRSSPASAKEDNIQHIYSLEELPVQPDLIIISNPTHLHYSSIVQAAAFGCPVFIEKPALSSPDNADKLVSLLEEKKIRSYVACNLRFLPVIEFVKKHIAEGRRKINEVNIYCGSYLPDWRPGQDFRKVYSSDENSGGGVHLDLIHELDYLYWIFGQPQQTHRITRNRSTLGISAADYANYSVIYDNFAASVILNYYRRDPKRSLEIVFEDETWMVDLLKNTIISGNRLIFESTITIADTYIRQMEYFTGCMASGEENMNGLKEALSVLKICTVNE